jgi:hypothetical protein
LAASSALPSNQRHGVMPDMEIFLLKTAALGGLIGSLYPSTAGTEGHAAGARVKRRVPKQAPNKNATALPSRTLRNLHKIKPAQGTRVPPHLVVRAIADVCYRRCAVGGYFDPVHVGPLV